MKKIFAIIIVALLATSMSFAAGSWTATTQTGEFTADIMCVPTFSITTVQADLGNYFTDGTYAVPSGSSITAALTGPNDAQATYTMTATVNGVTGPTQTFQGNDVVNIAAWGTTSPGWDKINNLPINDVTLTGTWSPLTDQTLSCYSSTNNNPVTAVFTPTSITIGGGFTGQVWFTVQVALSVAI